MEILLRPLGSTDLKSIEHINNTSLIPPWTQEALASELKLNDVNSSAACRGDSIIGYIFSRTQHHQVEIMSLVVDQDFQRKGVGSMLIKSILKNSPVFLEVSAKNFRAIEFYKRHGFTHIRTRRAYYRDGSDAFCMKLDLAKP